MPVCINEMVPMHADGAASAQCGPVIGIYNRLMEGCEVGIPVPTFWVCSIECSVGITQY
jgi:hypothetical protein